MLLKLSGRIADCLERARLSHERADKANDPILKDDYLEMERSWLRLAESYRTAEQVQTFIEDAERWRDNTKSNLPSDADIERLAERIVGNRSQ